MALVQHILSHAHDRADALALVGGGQQVSYGELAKRISVAAQQLAMRGVRLGDRVILSALPTPSFAAAYFGIHLAGAVAVPVDPRAPPEKLGELYKRVDAGLLVCQAGTPSMGAEMASLDELAAGTADPGAHSPPVDAESPADILFTSGTTQTAKGVVLSHRAIAAAANSINSFIGNTGDDREVLTLPLSHSFGLGRLRCALLAGSTMVMLDGLRAPAQLFEAMSEWDVTGMAAVPAAFALMFRVAGDELGRFSDQLRYMEIGSSAMPIADKKRLMRLLPDTRICMHYGLSEASRSAFIEFHESAHRLDSIGRASPGVEIRPVDQSGGTCPPGEVGRLLVRSPAVMSRYWDDVEGTERAFEGDYLVTGDVGHVDTDGYLFLDARESDIINLGGRKVAPQEVEAALLEYPGLVDCACAGIPDDKQVIGVALVAFIVLDQAADKPPTAREVIAHLRGKLEPYKVPTRLKWVAKIPKTESGKIQRHKLAEIS